jgi:hypothetical protein
MATLKDLRELMVRSGISDETVTLVIVELQRSFPSEKLYVTAPDTCNKKKIISASQRLPTGVVAERFGVTRRYVNMLAKKRN